MTPLSGLDTLELELMRALAFYVAEGTWMCPCENAFFVATSWQRMRFVVCDRCEQAAWVVPWDQGD